ncbi:MAG: zf-HC2 domain-containing protein [Oscillospiraceae bacterium]|nr:zf-HC2 domain-containing protein [Oscillospiraceae bacterium]
MKITCKVIEDLLPLYHDGVCSEDSRVLVEEHLKSCKKCGTIKTELDAEPEQEIREDVKAIRRIRKNIRKKVVCSVALGIALCLLLAAGWAVASYVNWQQERQDVLRFTEGKEENKPFRHIWAGGIWDGRDEYFQWSDSTGTYRFKVVIPDPFRGDCEVIATPCDDSPMHENTMIPWVWLEVEHDRTEGTYYRIGVFKPAFGVATEFVVDGELRLLEENEGHRIMLETHMEWIEPLVKAVEAEWPFLAE